MLFASFDFLLFLLPVFVAYWALEGRPRARAVVLVAAGYFFYMAAPKPVDGPPPPRYHYVGLLIGTTIVDFLCGRWIAAAPRGSSFRRALLAVSLSANLGLLGYFKYTGFLLEVASDVSRAFGSPLPVPAFSTVLPIGISFYTFQSLSYTVDVYRGRISAEPSLLRFASFITFFPQLVAGPIVRASQFLPQLYQRPQLTRQDVDFALYRIVKGVVKKVVFADFIAASFTDRVLASPAEFTALENWLALYAFTLQIYADFSGYSDVAIGTARLLGFRIPENFNRPYQALDVADFWRRWHMTLSTWLRDYVYYPLGGSRKGAARTYANLWLTMFLVGLWHGATVNFVIYAVLQASAMVFNRFTRRSPQSSLGRLLWLPLSALGPGLLILALARILELPNAALLGVLAAALGFLDRNLTARRSQPGVRAFARAAHAALLGAEPHLLSGKLALGRKDSAHEVRRARWPHAAARPVRQRAAASVSRAHAVARFRQAAGGIRSAPALAARIPVALRSGGLVGTKERRSVRAHSRCPGGGRNRSRDRPARRPTRRSSAQHLLRVLKQACDEPGLLRFARLVRRR